jgi:hypothetical protein
MMFIYFVFFYVHFFMFILCPFQAYIRSISPDRSPNREGNSSGYDNNNNSHEKRLQVIAHAHDDDKIVINELTHRIVRLEQKLRERDNSESYERKENFERREIVERKDRKIDLHDLESRINYLASDVGELSEQLNGTVINVRDVQRQSVQSMAQIGTVAVIVEEVQRDVDSRRGLLVKMDNWARLGEVWRSEVEEKIAGVNRNIKAVERTGKEQSESMLEMVSRNDFNLFRDRFVASASWKEKMEKDFTLLEKQCYNMQNNVKSSAFSRTIDDRSISGGNAGSSSSGGQLSQRQFEEIYSRLEDRFQDKIHGDIRSVVTDSMRDLEKKLKADMQVMIADLGSRRNITGGTVQEEKAPEQGQGQGRSSSRSSSGKPPKKEGVGSASDLQTVSNNLQHLTLTVLDLQSEKDREKSLSASISPVNTPRMDRRIEDSLDLSARAVRAVQERCAGLEDLIKEGEHKLKEKLAALKEELSSNVSSHEEEVTDSLISHEKRMLAIEKISGDVMSRLNMSNNAIDAYFESSEEAKKLKMVRRISCFFLYIFRNFHYRAFF